MAQALSADARTNLMFAPSFSERLKSTQGGLRKVVSLAATSGTPTPALAAALSYFDMMRTGRSTANLLQAQRDFFGRHTFERLDREGAHNGPWAEG
jgi:6-phosphogluconate dehydrogenase